MDGLAKYYYNELSEMNKDLLHQDQLLGSLQNVKISEVKSILIYKSSVAAGSEISTSIEVRDPVESLGVSTAVVCQMLGIFLDNAIEALADIADKQLNIAIIKNPTSTVFIIKNTWQRQNIPMGKLFKLGFSTKSDGRGVGLYTARSYTDKIQGLHLETEVSNEFFTQILTVKDV